MVNRIVSVMLAAIVTVASATSVLADTTVCTVKPSELRLRQSPGMKSRVVAVLKKDDRVTAQLCSGGWVKVASEDGRHSGYVGGWALTAATPKTPQASVASLHPAVAPSPTPAEPAINVTAIKEVPSNERLAIQVTQLRLNVLGIERDMEKLDQEIKQIKIAMRHTAATRRSAATSRKGHKLLAKR